MQQISAAPTVTRNLIIDRKRKHRERNTASPNRRGETFILKEVSEYLFDADNSPEKEYMRSLVWEELDKALAELPDEQRIVFELYELQNFSFKEISESSGIPVNTLISRKRYAVLYLRERLYNIYEELLGE
ncbi:MAG: RNA polymerase sigma factor [Butyricimonas faecihominis]